MPRDEDTPRRREYRPSDHLAPPQPDRSWRGNSDGQSDQSVPAGDLSWEPESFRQVPQPQPAPEPLADELPPDPPLDVPEDSPPVPEFGIMTPPLEPDEVIDPEDEPAEAASPPWRAQDHDREETPSAVSELRAKPRPPTPRAEQPEGLTVQERYEILLHTIELYQADWKLWRIRAHEESGKLQGILTPRQGGFSVREAYDRDQLLTITVDAEGNTDIREPAPRKPRGLRFWGNGNRD